MMFENFISLIADLFENTDAKDLKKETEFKKLDDWNSLVALSLIAIVASEYGKNISGDDIFATTTLNDLFVLIQNK